MDQHLKNEKDAKNKEAKLFRAQSDRFNNSKLETNANTSILSGGQKIISPKAKHVSKDEKLQNKFMDLKRKSITKKNNVFPFIYSDERKVLNWSVPGPSLEA